MPAASIFIEAGSGQATRRSALFGSRIVARVFDEDGNWLPGAAVQFVLPPDLLVPSGTFPGGVFDFTAITDADGRAESERIQADDLLGVWFGTIAAVAAPAVQATFYLSNIVVPRSPATITVTANGTQKAAQYTAYLPVTVLLQDGAGAGAPLETLTMTCPAGSGTFATTGSNSCTAVTDAGGYASFPAFTASGTTGNFVPTVTIPGVPVTSLNFTTVDPSIPAGISIYAGNNQSTPPLFLFNNQLVVRVANGLNGPVAGVGVTFDAPDTGASLVWASPYVDPVTRTSDSNGLATAPSMTANGTAGTYNVVATVPALFAQYFQLTNGGAPPVDNSTSALLISEA
jgi:hypothetical protein